MSKKKVEKLKGNKIPEKDSKLSDQEEHRRFLDAEMKEFFKIIDANIDVFKRLKDK